MPLEFRACEHKKAHGRMGRAVSLPIFQCRLKGPSPKFGKLLLDVNEARTPRPTADGVSLLAMEQKARLPRPPDVGRFLMSEGVADRLTCGVEGGEFLDQAADAQFPFALEGLVAKASGFLLIALGLVLGRSLRPREALRALGLSSRLAGVD